MIKCISSVKYICKADMLTEDNTWTSWACQVVIYTADKTLKSRHKPVQVLSPLGISSSQWLVGICFRAHSRFITTKSLFSQEFTSTVSDVWRTGKKKKRKKICFINRSNATIHTVHKLHEIIIIIYNKKVLKSLKRNGQNLRCFCCFSLH